MMPLVRYGYSRHSRGRYSVPWYRAGQRRAGRRFGPPWSSGGLACVVKAMSSSVMFVKHVPAGIKMIATYGSIPDRQCEICVCREERNL